MRTRIAIAAALAVVGTASSGCSDGGSAAGKAVTVFAASSLTNVFAQEAAAFTASTGRQVRFSFAGSQELVAQIRQGAPADVVATADQTTMSKLPSASDAEVFARNRLVIVTPADNPAHIHTAADLALTGVDVVLAAPDVPAGRYAAKALAAAHVKVHPRSLENDVRSVLTKVELGEADAGIVYASDAQTAANRVKTIQLRTSPTASYPVLALHARGHLFVDFLLSQQGQAILRRAGFLAPT